ncbi:MAG: SET domain-containing protein-lysine N-methyltransferase [Oligoflexia bacterium]|nr:SET domain-containing protein-lysine N-methyltransferase [Oligoflexia bacterium]MBF0364641.1 SET domain-containing protein-lysine N-methyltransferase [Oligoflexia bacterium]
MPKVIENGHLYYPRISEFFIDHALEYIPTKKYYGVFSRELIKKDQTVLKVSGQCYSDISDSPLLMKYSVILAPDFYLGPMDANNIEADWYLNHSCNPNLRRVGVLIYVAARDISPKEELTIDYSPLNATPEDGFAEMTCLCNDPGCRKIISSKDWTKPDLAKKLWIEWSPFIQKTILKMGLLK